MYGNQNNYYDVQASRENVSGYLVRTYRWMFLGLLLTFAVSYLGFATGFVWNILSGPAMVLLTIAEFGVVIYLSARINQMAPGTATALFFAYAALNGLVFSVYFLVFDAITMIFAFAVAALYFGVMAVYGSVTKKDLSGICWAQPQQQLKTYYVVRLIYNSNKRIMQPCSSSFSTQLLGFFVCYGTNDISKDVSNRECFKSIFYFAK